jgi:hypothetical protein
MNQTTKFAAPVLFSLLQLASKTPANEPLASGVQRALAPRAAAEIERVGRNLGMQVSYVCSKPLFDGFLVFEAPQRDWVLTTAAQDPLLVDRDGFPVPQATLAALERLNRAGVDFPVIYLAHEVQKGKLRPGEQPTADLLAPPGPAQVLRTSKGFAKTGASLWRTALAPLRASSAVVVGAAAGLAGLDPIVLGARVPFGASVAPGSMADWFYLAHWIYNPQET